MLGMTKIQNGGLFLRWPPNGTRFLGFAGKHSEMGIEVCNMANIIISLRGAISEESAGHDKNSK